VQNPLGAVPTRVQAPEGAVTSKVQAPRGALTIYIHYSDHCNLDDPTICNNCRAKIILLLRCPAFEQEKEIIHLKCTDNLTFTEARKRVIPKTQLKYQVRFCSYKKTVSEVHKLTPTLK